MVTQTVGQIIGQHQTTTSLTHRRQHSTECVQLSARQIETCSLFKSKHNTIQSVFNAYAPDKWDYVLENIVAAINTPAPTLSQLDSIYNTTGAGKALFVNQITGYYTMIERSGKPMNQQAAELAAKQFMGRYAKICTPPMLLAYFANYSEFKGTMRDFDTEDIIKQFGKKFLSWWGDKTNQHYKPKKPEAYTDNYGSRGKEALIEVVAEWLKKGETENDIRNPDKHGLYRYGAITDEIINKAKDLALSTF